MPIKLLGLVARLPLRLLHAIGALVGWAIYAASPTYRSHLRANLANSKICADEAAYRRTLRGAIEHAGRGGLELTAIWLRPVDEVVGLVRRVSGWEHVAPALAEGRGVMFLTPHLGCFDIVSLYIAARIPLTALYRPPKISWLDPLMVAGRQRVQVELVPTDTRGVRAMLRALKRGRAIGLLPDQAPTGSDGQWADFFGRPAYTMTVAGRMAAATGARIIMVFARRLPRGEGYDLTFEPVPALPDDPQASARVMNRALEDLIRTCPEQYLWSYNRYKTPKGAPPPPAPGTGSA